MTIEDDMLVEDDKTFTILLTNATEIYNITLEGGTLNITENEGIYTICKLSPPKLSDHW